MNKESFIQLYLDLSEGREGDKELLAYLKEKVESSYVDWESDPPVVRYK